VYEVAFDGCLNCGIFSTLGKNPLTIFTFFTMNKYFTIRLLNATCSILLVAILMVFGTRQGHAQTPNTPECNAGSYVFAGVPEATLCSQYPNFQPDYKIGAGTQFPTASSFGSSISGNVHIVGDFQVDETFTFTNATVKVDVGRAILVGTSNGLSGGNHLTISGSKFFACDDMWRV
jgi:hypothetical protein